MLSCLHRVHKNQSIRDMQQDNFSCLICKETDIY
jgi:hypothetical protein